MIARRREPIGVAIVDDDRRYAESLAELLVLDERVVVVGKASSVADGLELLGSDPVDIGLVDVHMPDGGGLLVAELLRHWESAPLVALISATQPTAETLASGLEFLAKAAIEPDRVLQLVLEAERQ